MGQNRDTTPGIHRPPSFSVFEAGDSGYTPGSGRRFSVLVAFCIGGAA